MGVNKQHRERPSDIFIGPHKIGCRNNDSLWIPCAPLYPSDAPFHCEWKQGSSRLCVAVGVFYYLKYRHVWNVNLFAVLRAVSVKWYIAVLLPGSFTSHSFPPVPSSPNLQLPARRQLASTHKPLGEKQWFLGALLCHQMKTSWLVVTVKADWPMLGSLPPTYRETDERITLVGGRGRDLERWKSAKEGCKHDGRQQNTA